MNGLPDMNQKRYNIAAIKERLSEYRENERDIDNQIERLERLVSKMTGAGAQVIIDMPKTRNTTDDRMAEFVGQKEELEKSIKRAIDEQNRERLKIEAILKKLRHSDERAVIRMRYFDRESWNAVTEMMFGRMDDFEGKEDTYLRRVYKIHGSALLNMARTIEDDLYQTNSMVI